MDSVSTNSNIIQIIKDIPANLMQMCRQPQFYGFFISLFASAILALAYFYPDATMGNELRQHDMQQGAAIGQEVKAYVEATGDEAPRFFPACQLSRYRLHIPATGFSPG